MSRAGADAENIEEIATLRIVLRYTDPPIWRRVEAPTALTLKNLHDIIQAAMDWEDYHLWEFTAGERRYGPPMPGGGWDDVQALDARKARLGDLLGPGRRTVIGYIYDFGDSWELDIIATKIRRGEPGVGYPRYIDGENNAPPEDCGGIPGFYHALDAIADPGHPDHAEVRDWFGDYNPDSFEDLPIKLALGGIAKRRRAGKARWKKR